MTTVTISETDDPIDICLDIVFKAVFTRDSPKSRGALSKLVFAVTGRELTVVVLTANEPSADNIRDRQICFDLTFRGKTVPHKYRGIAQPRQIRANPP
jgi:thiamine kinase-like enzyme